MKSRACTCEERKKPVIERNWKILQYHWNSGAFVVNGGKRSDYSTVRCLSCNNIMRTKANYVEEIYMHRECKSLEEYKRYE